MGGCDNYQILNDPKRKPSYINPKLVLNSDGSNTILSNIDRTRIFRTSNELERVHLLVIELEHPIFGFERSNIELRT